MDLTEEEVVHMNNYCVETSEITGKDYERIEPEVAGTYQLNGVQAVSYARIRYTAGGDFERTSRQRLVIEKLVEKKIHFIGVDCPGIREHEEHQQADRFCERHGVYDH